MFELTSLFFFVYFRFSVIFTMAHRQLMAVCVVCLLCADHVPCIHVLTPGTNSVSNESQKFLSSSDDAGMLTKGAEASNIYLYDKRKDKTKDLDKILERTKRHADHEHHEQHHHHEETPEVTKAYIKKLFTRFSDQNTDTMTAEGFDNMIKFLDLDYLRMEQPVESKENLTCMKQVEFLEKMTDQKELEDHDHDHYENEKDHHHHQSFLGRLKIETKDMLSMCPILLYQIVNRQSPLERDGCLNASNFITSELAHDDDFIEMEPRSKVWLYSTLSIIGVSLCGLLGVAVIPIMEKHFYHHVLQFLVALAVGTLAGDALLHLLPHAMMPINTEQDLHQTMMYRGLAAVCGIVFFYFFERFLTMATEWRQRKQKHDKPSSRVRVIRDPESVSLNNGTATSCMHKYSSYPYCYDEIALDTKDDHHEHQHVEGAVLNNHIDKTKSDDEHLHIMSPTDGKKMNGMIVDHNIDTDNNTLSTSLDDGSVDSSALCNNNKHAEKSVAISTKKDSVQAEDYKIILR